LSSENESAAPESLEARLYRESEEMFDYVISGRAGLEDRLSERAMPEEIDAASLEEMLFSGCTDDDEDLEGFAMEDDSGGVWPFGKTHF
jgi:hypothetical protein